MSTIIEDLQWLADSRARYLGAEAHAMYNGTVGSFWSLPPAEQAVYAESTGARHAADIVVGENDGMGWLPSWLWDDWDERIAERQARQREAHELRGEVEYWVKDYVRLYPTPYGLPPNLTLATRALALLHAETGL